MKPGAGFTADYRGEVLAALAAGLAADTVESGRKALEVVRARSPELVLLSEDTGEDLVATSAGFIDILLASLRSDLELPWAEYDERSRSYGQIRAAQGVPLESLIDVLAVYRRATIELISLPLRDSPRRDEIFALAQSRLENVAERLTTLIARGYIDHLDAERRARENEMFGLASIVRGCVGRVTRRVAPEHGRDLGERAVLLQAAAHRRSRRRPGRRVCPAGRPSRESVGVRRGQVRIARRSHLRPRMECSSCAASSARTNRRHAGRGHDR